MNHPVNVNFCVFDAPVPTKTEEGWKIIKYGEESVNVVRSGFLQDRAMVASEATKYEIIDLFSTGNVTHATSGTSSHLNIEIPDNTWFINDKTRSIIVYNHRAHLPQEMTWSSCIHAELPQNSIPAQFNQAFQRIGRLIRFAENWDSYGAKSIDKECISRGVNILKELVKFKFNKNIKIPIPFVAPLSSGGIQIEWEEGEKYLEISINPDPLAVDYFATDKAKEGQLTLEGSLRSMSALKELLTWFISGTPEGLAQLVFEEPYDE